MTSPGNDTASRGFAAVSAPDARVLVLGSLPGVKSIAEQQYYAHPQNAFWRIMRAVLGVEGSYAARSSQLTEHGVALWDVLASSRRPGSLDADIDVETARANDFADFLATHTAVRRICFNGRKAESLFRRLVLHTLDGPLPRLVGLPSTSPAYAAMPFAVKLEHWQAALDAGLSGEDSHASRASGDAADKARRRQT